MIKSKKQQQRNEKALQNLIATVPGNNQCADCFARNPGWASWSLGIFLCMRCAALHRKLGTHISKVKSISLDTWSNEQVKMMEQTGNINSNAMWNPDATKNAPPVDLEDSESIMERYIRNKYEHGKFRRDSQKDSSRLLNPSSAASGAGLARQASPGPRTSSRGELPRSSSPFESKGGKILGMNGGASTSIPPEYEAKVAKLKDMGFSDERQNAQVLKQTKGNMERAVELLISMGGGMKSPVPPPKDKPIVKKKSNLMLGGVKGTESSGGNPFDKLDQEEAMQQQQQQQQQQQAAQLAQQQQQLLQQQQAPQLFAPQAQQPQTFLNGQNGLMVNGIHNGLAPAGYNPFLQPQVTGYQQQQIQQVQPQQQQTYLNGNGQWGVQNPFLQQQQTSPIQQQQPFAQPQQTAQFNSPWGDIPTPQPQYATSNYTGSSSAQSPMSATNPFFNNGGQAQQLQSPSNPFGVVPQQQQQQQQVFQQAFTPPLQPQQQANGASPLPVAFQASPFQDPNQAYLQQQQQQQQLLQQQQQQLSPFGQQNGLAPPAAALMPQLTGRADKSTIMQLYNYPQFAPAPSAAPQSVPAAPQQRSVSSPLFPNSGSNNPFASKLNGGGDAGISRGPGVGRGHMTQESVDFGSLQSGRHSPDAFASLSSAAFRHR